MCAPCCAGRSKATEHEGALTFGDLQIDRGRREVRVRDRDVQLTRKEFDLLEHLASSPGITFTRIALLEAVWDFAWDGDTATVTVHIRRLREKIEDDPSSPRTPGDGVGRRLPVRAMRGTLRAVALVVLVAAAGGLAALAVGAADGDVVGDLAHLLVPLAVSTAVTVGTAVAANAALARTSLRYRFLVVAVLGAGVALANLAVMAKLMLVSEPRPGGRDAAGRVRGRHGGRPRAGAGLGIGEGRRPAGRRRSTARGRRTRRSDRRCWTPDPSSTSSPGRWTTRPDGCAQPASGSSSPSTMRRDLIVAGLARPAHAARQPARDGRGSRRGGGGRRADDPTVRRRDAPLCRAAGRDGGRPVRADAARRRRDPGRDHAREPGRRRSIGGLGDRADGTIEGAGGRVRSRAARRRDLLASPGSRAAEPAW